MSNIRTLRDTFPGSDWKSAFVNALMRLRPDLNPDAVDEISDSEFVTAQAMHPDTAAAHWADTHTRGAADRTRRA